MKRKINLCLLIIALLLLSSCHLNSNPNNNPIEDPDKVKDPIKENIPDESIIDDFFDIKNKISIQINISDDELLKLHNDYDHYSNMGSKSPIYRKCDIVIMINNEKYVINEVGIRMKGNTSRQDFYSSKDGIYNLVHFKLSFSQTFDSDYYENKKIWSNEELRKERKKRTFLGMEKLDLKWNKSGDETYVREYYAYNMFREYGVLAPHSNIVNLSMTSKGKLESLGLYFALECIDETFINRYLPAADQGGNLYKCAWGTAGGSNLTTINNAIGIEDEDTAYFPTYDLKTNKKTADHSLLENLINTLNNKSTVQLNTIIDDLIDVDKFIIFESVCYFLGNPDDMRNHYNNYYIYFLGSSNKAIFIPFDFDRTLGITKDWNPTKDGMIKVLPFSRFETCTCTESQENPLLNKTILNGGNSRLIKLYKDKLISINNDDYFSVQTLREAYNIVLSNYGTLIKPSIKAIENDYVRFAIDVSSNGNLIINDYIVEKKKTLENELK